MAIKRRYIHFIEKDSRKMSLMWKALHVLLFALASMDAFCSVFAFNYLLDGFNYRCILFVKPVFDLRKITYNETKVEKDENRTDTGDVNPEFLLIHEWQEDIIDDECIPGLNFKVPKVPDVEVKDGRYWVNNKTLTAQVVIDLRKTVFTDVVTCDWILFLPLCTIIISVFLGVLFIMFERGGGGYRSDIFRRPWSLVYPCLVISGLVAIFHLIIAATVDEGLTTFCSYFKQYTGEGTCSQLMNYFTIQRRFGKKNFNFYYAYLTCQYSFPLGIILWLLQIGVHIMRIVSGADFQLASTVVECKNHTKELTEDAVHQALLKAYPALERAVLVTQETEQRQSVFGRRSMAIGHATTHV